MKILALDLGKIKSVGCLFDSETAEHAYETVRSTPFAIHQFLERRRPDRIVFETSSMAGWVYDVAAQLGVPIEVANPNHESWRWRNTKSKTDRKDALKLAKLSAMGQLPTVHMPSPAVRQWRALIKFRQKLVGRRTAIKNNIRCILDRQGVPMKSGTTGWSGEGLAYLQALSRPLEDVELSDLWRGQLHEELQALAGVEARIKSVQQKLDAIGRANGRVNLLQTIPGVGPRLAEALVAAIDDPHRFRNRREVSSYFGLVPRQYESGQMSRSGRITKQGNSLVRNLLVEVSWLALRYNPWVRQTYRLICRGSRSRRHIAIVAVARRLVVRAWAMLRDGTEWRAPAPASSEPPQVVSAGI
jgi:transposase